MTYRLLPRRLLALALSSSLVLSLASCASADRHVPIAGLQDYDPTESDPATDSWTSSLHVLLGGRDLDQDTWGAFDGQGAVGIEFDSRPSNSPLGFEIGMQASTRSRRIRQPGLDPVLDASVGEIYAGPKLTFELGPEGSIRPFVGAGIGALRGRLESYDGTFFDVDSDGSLLGYVHGGVYYSAHSAFNVGVDARYVYGTDVDLYGSDGDADYFQVGLLFGINF